MHQTEIKSNFFHNFQVIFKRPKRNILLFSQSTVTVLIKFQQKVEYDDPNKTYWPPLPAKLRFGSY